MDENELVITQQAAADMLGCARRTIVRMIRAGTMPEPIAISGSIKHHQIWRKKDILGMQSHVDAMRKHAKSVPKIGHKSLKNRTLEGGD